MAPSATCVEDFGDEIVSPPIHPSLVPPSQNQSTPIALHISLIGAYVFHVVLKKPGTQSFKIWSTDSKVKIRSTKPSDGAPYDPLIGVPKEYHEFVDVFSKQKAQVLSDHRSYDLKIDLEDGAVPLSPSHLYSISALEQETLQAFIQENLNTGFIRPSKSGHGVPVLFACKKDGSLWLCCDFRGLNKITKKDRYPLLLINDLLDTLRKGHLYTKIDLRHTYHLVCVMDGDE